MHFADYSLNINKIVIEALMLAGGIWFKKQAGCEKSVMALMLLFSFFLFSEGGKYNSQGREAYFVYLSESSSVPVTCDNRTG